MAITTGADAATTTGRSGTWTLETTPAGDEVTLSGVSCWSNGCTAVGTSGLDVVYGWHGSVWASQPAPAGVPTTVACSAANVCIAVGYVYTSKGGTRAQAWSWNGTAWRAQATFNPKSSSNSLSAIRCSAGTSSCEAVGYYGNGGTSYPLAEYWNGRTWTGQSTSGAPPGELTGVSCESRGASLGPCEAVGQNSYLLTPLAMGLSRTKWTTQATPKLPKTAITNEPSAFTGVSCYSGGCMAVGWYEYSDVTPDTSGNSFIIERWNGSKWTLAAYPWARDTSDTPNAVHCESASNCTAVGWSLSQGDATSAHDTLVMAWNGTSLTTVPSPDPNVDYDGGQGDGLNAIACVSGGAVCTAVGQQEDPNSPSYPSDSLAIRN